MKNGQRSGERSVNLGNFCYNRIIIKNGDHFMAKAKSTKSSSATLGFEQQIWEAACELWGHIPAADYRKIFTGLIFLKYISAAFDKKYTELVEEGEGFEKD